MLHKTIYIDIDEEITSVIDRMRKSTAVEVIIVAPKRALLLQSLVNLKLLKKESDRRKRRIMIVTQDKIGKKLIEKAGILVQGKVDDSMAEQTEMDESAVKKKELIEKQELIEKMRDEQQEEGFGSESYFDEPLQATVTQDTPFPEKELKNNNIDRVQFDVPAAKKTENIQAKETKKNGVRKTKDRLKNDKSVRMSDIVAGPHSKNNENEDMIAEKKSEENYEIQKAPVGVGHFYKNAEPDPHFEKRAEKFFSAPSIAKESISRRKAGKLNGTKLKGKVSRFFILFTTALFFLGALAAVYLYLPKASIVLHLKSQEKNSSVDIKAETAASGIDVENGIIPARMEQMEKEISQDFKTTGSKDGSGKATGKIVIYNDFSPDNQSLVATTRFETTEGKVYRITKAVVVPGMTKVGTDSKSGAIEVDVVADKAGEEYNIDPTDFKIPGFKGSPKYDKFYARSAKAMTGGGSTGDTAVLTSQDIAQAKDRIIAEIKTEAAKGLRQDIDAQRKIFDDSVVVELESAIPSATAGTQTDKFSLGAKVKIKALSYLEDDVKQIIIAKGVDGQKLGDTMNFSSSINYILVEENIKDGFVKFQAKTDLGVTDSIDLENFKKGSLGKSAGEIESFVKSYPAILKAQVNFWPFFATRVPMNEKRVEVEVKAE